VAAVAVEAGDRGEWEPWFGPVAEAVEQLGGGVSHYAEDTPRGETKRHTDKGQLIKAPSR
jgi:hypothetical protein